MHILAKEIKGTLAQHGLENTELGYTYLADRVGEDGKPIQSSLDHIYRSVDLELNTQCCKLKDSSTDHVPIKITIKSNNAKRNQVTRSKMQSPIVVPKEK